MKQNQAKFSKTETKVVAPSESVGISTFQKAILLFLLILLSWWVFSSVKQFGFVWDDLEYVQTNEILNKPLSTSIPHFFEQNYFVGNYHPLTMSVYALIYQNAKLDPALYHLVVLWIHLLNVLLVFWFVWKLASKHFGIALFVAACFAVHPMHVESVAWISELKDVMYGFFFLGGMTAYLYALDHKKSWLYHIICFVLFIASVLSKPAAVVFPLALLSIDYFKQGHLNFKNGWSKAPYFIVSLLMGLLTIKAQGDAVGEFEHYNFLERIMLSSYAFIYYLYKLILPLDLSALHPFPTRANGAFPWIYQFSPVFLACILGAIWWWGRKKSHWIFALMFYFVNIFLVLQFITVGMAVVSERYTYIPYIGLFYALALECRNRLSSTFTTQPMMQWSLAIVPVLLMAWLSQQRVQVWKNNRTLWSDVVVKHPETAVAYYNLGTYFMKEARDDDSALNYYQKAIQREPKHQRALINLGLINGRKKNKELSMQYFTQAEAIDSEFPELYKNRGLVHSMLSDLDAAFIDFSKYLEKVPADAQILFGRGMIYQMRKQNNEAYMDFNKAVQFEKTNPKMWLTLAQSAQMLGKNEEAKNAALVAQRLGANLDPGLKSALGL